LGEVHLYDAVDARNISLKYTSGDADLFIVDENLNELSLESLSCASENSDQIDACVISDSTTKQIAIVYGYGDGASSYQIVKDDELVDLNGMLVMASANTTSGGIGLYSILLVFVVRIARSYSHSNLSCNHDL